MNHPIVSIVFRDIVGTADWTTHEEVECLPVEVIGFLVSKDDDTVKIATARTPESEYSAVHAIPTGCITRIEILVQTPPAPLSDLSDSEDSDGQLTIDSHGLEHTKPSLVLRGQ
jgi:hypothetical protein